MRKIHMLLLLILVLGIAFAYRATFPTKLKCGPGTKCATPMPIETTNLPVQEPSQATIPGASYDGTPPEEIPPSEYAKHIVNGRTFVLLARYDTSGTPTITLVESKNGKYQPLDSSYNWVKKYIDNDTDDFWFMPEQKQLYLFKMNYDTNESELSFIDYADINNIHQASVDTLHNGLYESKHFLDFNPEKDSFVLISQGGDSCGGWGGLFTLDLKTKALAKIKDIGFGCTAEARFFDYKDKKLILADTVPCAISDSEFVSECLPNIYSVDPYNMDDKEILYTFEKPYLFDQGLFVSDEIRNKMTADEVTLSKIYKTPPDYTGYVGVSTKDYILNLKTKELRAL